MESALLANYIVDNKIVSTCDFIPKLLNKGKVIYEVIRVIDGKPLFLRDHIDRFTSSLNQAGCIANISIGILVSRIKTLIEVNKLSEGNIKFQLSIEKDSITKFSTWVIQNNYPSNKLYKSGIHVATISRERQNPNLKIFNHGFKSSISDYISEKGLYEVLLVNEKGNITEGSKSNVFFLKENTIFTPKTEHVLPGITRKKVIQIAKKAGIKLYEQDISQTSIHIYNAAFLSGTSPKILPILYIDKIQYNTQNTTINMIIDEYDLLIKEDISSFNWDSF